MGKEKVLKSVSQMRELRPDIVRAIARARFKRGFDEASERLQYWWNDGEAMDIVSGAAGIYQGKEFAEIDWKPTLKITGVDESDLDILRKGPPGAVFSTAMDDDEDLYWEVWCNVIDGWDAVDEDGRQWHLENCEADGSLMMVSDLFITDEEVEQTDLDD